MSFSSKQVATMVVAISAAVIFAPMAVVAATGQFVNIVDPGIGTRQVRVGSGGSLMVETRPGVTRAAGNVNHVDITSLTPRTLLEVVSPTRIAVSEVTIGVRDAGNPVVAPTIVDLIRYVQTTGTNPCGQSGWAPTVLRRVTLKTDETMHLKFDGPPLMVAPAANGQRVCLAAKLYQWVGDTRVDIGATIFSYE